MAQLIFGAFLLTILISSTIAVVPSYIKICGRRNPEINKCIENSVNELKIKLTQGIPELDVPSMDSLLLENVTLADIKDFRAIASNVSLRGISNFDIKHLNFNLKNQILELELLHPKVFLDAEYDVKAKILVPVNEKGPISVISDNVLAKVTLKYKTVDRRSRQFIYFPTMTLKLEIPDYVANFKSSADNNPLTEAINAVLVDSRQEIIQSMTPNLEKALSVKIIDIVNRICKNFTYDELFPDRT